MGCGRSSLYPSSRVFCNQAFRIINAVDNCLAQRMADAEMDDWKLPRLNKAPEQARLLAWLQEVVACRTCSTLCACPRFIVLIGYPCLGNPGISWGLLGFGAWGGFCRAGSYLTRECWLEMSGLIRAFYRAT